jgi:hypothetical protein
MPERIPSRPVWIATLAAWVGTYIAARYGVELAPAGSTLRVLVALAPVAPTVLVLWLIWRSVRALDELQRRVQLEALAVAFPLCIVMLWVLGLLELATDLDRTNWSYRHVWAMVPMFYFIGLALAWRRYK